MRIDLIGTVAVRSTAAGSDHVDAGHPASGPVAGDAVVGVALGGRRARLALASLALHRNVVTPDALAAHIWGENPPPTWPVALRGLISGLRVALQPLDGSGAIVTEPHGYRLGPDVVTDIELAGRGLDRAAEWSAAGRWRSAVEIAVPISELSGSQLLIGEDDAWLTPHRTAIDAVSVRATEIVIDAFTALREFHSAIAAGRRAVAADPLNERSQRALMRALDASGDRPGVVQTYEMCRAVLADELGVDPSAATTQTYLAALGGQASFSGVRLPTVTDSFHAREQELANLNHELTGPGVLVLSGRGGVGKSRLALEAARAARHFEGGRFWVNVSCLVEDALLAATVAIAMEVDIGADDPTGAIAARLAPLGRSLLILDGCEQVADGVGSLADALVAGCPWLTVLATSRVPLPVQGGREVFLRPFPVPGADPAELASSPLMALLTARIRTSNVHWVFEPATAAHLQALLRWSAGLPLAIELVAAQLAASSPADLLDVLPDGQVASGDALRGIVRAGYLSLTDDEAAVFRRFAVLDGEVSLPILRGVVSAGAIPALRVVRILRELAVRGMIGVDAGGPRWRYRQDDDLRRFASELLVQNGEQREAFDRLAEVLIALLPSDPREPPASFQDSVTEALAQVRSLLRAGLLGLADREKCLELAFRLHRYWAATNVGEGRFWLGRLLAGAGESRWTAYATYALGYLDYWSGATDTAVVELRKVVALLADVDDPYKARALIYLAGMLDDVDLGAEAVGCVRSSMTAAAPFGPDLQVTAAMGMGSVLSERGWTEAATHAAAAIALCRAHGSAEQLAAAMPTAAMICWQVGELEDARAYIAEALPLHRRDRRIARVVLLSAAAGVALADGDIRAASEFGALADQEGTALGVEREMPLIRSVLARSRLAAGDLPAAIERVAGALDVALVLEFTFPLATCLETAAVVLAAGARSDPNDLDQLLRSAAGIRITGDRPTPATLASAVERLRAAVLDDLTPDGRGDYGRSEFGVTSGVVEGSALAPRDAAQMALRLLRGQ